jgi:hypothetical protein
MRFLMLYKAKEDLQAGPPSPEHIAAMGKLIEDMTKAGVLLSTEGCQPSTKGVRVRRSGDKLTVTDGPFTEAKELIAGFAMVQAKSKEEAIELAKRFLAVAGDGESEIRQVHEEGDFGPEFSAETGRAEERQRVGGQR